MNNSYINKKVQEVLNMLDEAIDEYERGEFISEEEFWEDMKRIDEEYKNNSND